MNAREREEYLREYSILKSQGKPFFPYAVAKDGAMASIVLLVIIVMAILFGAELGPKADPTTTTYSPRPEWYFFFLFELLRVIKPPELVFLATMGIPTACLMLLILLPFYDRSPERHPLKRPVAMVAAVATVAAMTYLSVLGAIAGPPSEIDITVASKYEEGKQVTAASGCLGCHKIGENGNTLGPNLSEIGDRLGKDAIARTLVNPTSPMPSYAKLQANQPEQFAQMVEFVSSLKKDK
ncbi:MAG: menaquinol-cytochrome c reductase cytochrome b/c subunit [Thermoleophilaceae bacterium]|nr:menaquinol-cytochrome c reductase cytochrome b/c subunit [Thermoleophilaceae bacterium]